MKMANTQSFQSLKGMFVPDADTMNPEGAPAYVLLCGQVDTKFIAQTAANCRERGYMNDMPALVDFQAAQSGREAALYRYRPAAHWVGEIESIAL